MKRCAPLCLVLAASYAAALGQSVSNYAVQVSAAVQSNPPQITLSWVPDPFGTNYQVSRKLKEDRNWGPWVSLPANATNFVDSSVVVGASYEYLVYKTIGDNAGEGYVYAGIQTPVTEDRGKVIPLVDNTHAPNLATELARLQRDLVGDGWIVLRHDVGRADSVTNIKAIIKADYNSDTTNVKAVFLLGHVPVPYSGNLKPDGHDEHRGAWPADAYYGDMQGTWTDSWVNTTNASDPRNRNVPGDGKFDQSDLPWDVALQVGRVDFANLPAFAISETELLRRYLNKDHNFRHGLLGVQRRGLIDDNFGVLHYGMIGIEAFAVNGWRNYPPFFGASNSVASSSWFGTLATNSFLWGYGCGPGTFTSCGGVGSTADFAANDPQLVFTMFFGSWFGDWDSRDNFMRAALATPTHTLASVWAGRPYWYFHHMGLGETIGFSTRVSQNNYFNYGDSLSMYQIHPALMGDPTLRMHPVAPPARLLLVTNASAGVDLNWNASLDTVVGYHVYRATNAAGPFTRLTTNLLAGTSFTDTAVTTNVYMVRAVKLEATPSGSYYNPSQGIFQDLNNSFGPPVLKISHRGTGWYVIRGNGIPDRTYRLQFSDEPQSTNWQTLGTAAADLYGVFQFDDTNGPPQRFYRSVYP